MSGSPFVKVNHRRAACAAAQIDVCVSFPLPKVSPMKKFLLASTVLALLGVSVTMSVMAQPPRDERPPGDGDRPDGPPPEGRRGDRGPDEPGRPPMRNPLVAALDKNGDHEISAEELAAATASLLTLDKNGDGKLTDEETRPPRPEGGREGGPRGEGPPGREGGQRDGGPRDGAPREGGREGAPRDGGERGQRPGAGPMGPPNAERLIEHAMHFDVDGDGKLDKAELTKFAEEFVSRMGRPGGPGGDSDPGGRRPGSPDGEGSPFGGGRPGGQSENPEGERPRRPAAE